MGRDPSKEPEDFISNFRRTLFIRVEAEDPFMGAGFDGFIPQMTKALKRNLNDAGSQVLGDPRRVIGAGGIGHDDLISPQYTVDGVGDFLRLVIRNNVGRKGHARISGCEAVPEYRRPESQQKNSFSVWSLSMGWNRDPMAIVITSPLASNL